MQRSFSVEDLVGGLSGLVKAGMGRTDSEAAFQEFLKRIPSATNLAAAASASQQLDGIQQLNAASQHLLAGGAVSASGTPGPSPPEGASATRPTGIPPVASLDALRQVLQQNLPTAASKADPGPVVAPATALAGAAAAPVSAPPALDTSALVSLAALQALPPFPSSAAAAPSVAASTPALLAAAAFNPAAATAALGLGQLGQLSLGGGSVALNPNGSEPVEKQEVRRQRRMLSNRESARRSRKRKQEQIHLLEQQVDELAALKKEAGEVVAVAERRCGALEEENCRLREENERLRDELRLLRAEMNECKERQAAGGLRRGLASPPGRGVGHREERAQQQQQQPVVAAAGTGTAGSPGAKAAQPAGKHARASAARAAVAAPPVDDDDASGGGGGDDGVTSDEDEDGIKFGLL